MWLFTFVTSITILITWTFIAPQQARALIAITWTFIAPQQARALIAEIKRKLRLKVIQHAGERAARAAAQELFKKAVQAGHDPDLVKEILEEDWDIIRDRLGKRIADDIFGEPSPLERYG